MVQLMIRIFIWMFHKPPDSTSDLCTPLCPLDSFSWLLTLPYAHLVMSSGSSASSIVPDIWKMLLNVIEYANNFSSSL